MSGARVSVEVDGVELSLSNLEKPLYPTGFTKGDLIGYYLHVAPAMLAHLSRRPVTVRRFPNGTTASGFYEKNVPRGAPEWLQSVVVGSFGRRGEGEVRYPLVDAAPALIYLANLAAVEFHVPMWRTDEDLNPADPDELVFDLDPGPPAGIEKCCEVALLLREVLGGAGLSPVAKTSGRKGMQLYCAVSMSADEARATALMVAEEFSSAHPKLAVANMRKDLRRNKVLIDWSQNVPAKTTVAPYSLRAESVPSASTPLRWDEVEAVGGGGDAESLRFTPAQVLERVVSEGDLFAPALARR